MSLSQKINQAIKKHSLILDEAKNLISQIKNDPVHDIRHTEDVFEFAQKILEINDFDCNIDAIVVSVFWHDVGRLFVGKGHEQKSAEMLRECFKSFDYDQTFVDACCTAVGEHNYTNIPSTIEGKVLHDADILALLGKRRWLGCIQENVSLMPCIELLPDFEDKYLALKESKQLCKNAYVDIISLLYDFLQNKA